MLVWVNQNHGFTKKCLFNVLAHLRVMQHAGIQGQCVRAMYSQQSNMATAKKRKEKKEMPIRLNKVVGGAFSGVFSVGMHQMRTSHLLLECLDCLKPLFSFSCFLPF